ncbi:MAG: bactofilin family protein [Pseudomonadales bacterium]
MKMLDRVKRQESDQVSLIAENCQFQGEISFSAQLIVNGRLSGLVSAETPGSCLTVGVRGEVVGNVQAPNITISGVVKGDIYATEHIELTETARVSGNLFYHSLQMARGSRCTGSLRQLQPLEIKALIAEGSKVSRNTSAGRLQSVNEKQVKD